MNACIPGPPRGPGRNVLYWAVVHRNLQIVLLLLDKGACADDAAVWWTAARGGASTLKALLDHGGSPNATNHMGEPALHAVVAWREGAFPDRLRLLLAHPGTELLALWEGKTAEQVAAEEEEAAPVAALAAQADMDDDERVARLIREEVRCRP